MTLSVIERMTILGIIPKDGSFTTLKIITDLQDALGFTEEEHAILQFTPVEGGQAGEIRWNNGVEEKELEVGPKAEEMIVKALEKLNKEEKLTMQTFPLYKRFVIGDK